jgi:hypothetical protein
MGPFLSLLSLTSLALAIATPVIPDSTETSIKKRFVDAIYITKAISNRFAEPFSIPSMSLRALPILMEWHPGRNFYLALCSSAYSNFFRMVYKLNNKFPADQLDLQEGDDVEVLFSPLDCVLCTEFYSLFYRLS